MPTDSKKVLPKVIQDIHERLAKENIDITGYRITIDTMSHSNGHNNHSDHTDTESQFVDEMINPMDRLNIGRFK